MTGEGIYAVPEQWPNCTETVLCGPPVEPTINGSRIWLNQENEVLICFEKFKNEHLN